MVMPRKSDEHKKEVRKTWEQRLLDNDQLYIMPSRNSKPISNKIEEKQRECLKCGNFFLSSWIGNRRCKRCTHNINAHISDNFIR